VLPLLAFLHGGSRSADGRIDTAFRQGLAEAGCVDARNVAIDYQFADGQLDRLPGMEAELVKLQAAVIVVVGSDAARAAILHAAAMQSPDRSPPRWVSIQNFTRTRAIAEDTGTSRPSDNSTDVSKSSTFSTTRARTSHWISASRAPRFCSVGDRRPPRPTFPSTFMAVNRSAEPMRRIRPERAVMNAYRRCRDSLA
jgi:putative ABC transport system substrate-binding protein